MKMVAFGNAAFSVCANQRSPVVGSEDTVETLLVVKASVPVPVSVASE
jgi:hypothetical protein